MVKWSIIRAVVVSKNLVQQGSVETLYQNGNSLEQIAGFTVVARYRLSPAKKPYADAFIVPKYSTVTGWKMCVLSKPVYLAALRVAAASSAEPAFVAESPMYNSAKGQTTATSQVSGFPSLQGTIISPSGRLPVCRLPWRDPEVLWPQVLPLTQRREPPGR